MPPLGTPTSACEAVLAYGKNDSSLLSLSGPSMWGLGQSPDSELLFLRMDPDSIAARIAADRHIEMTEERYRTTVGRLIWQMGTAVVLALILLVVLALVKRIYMIQEILIVTLVVAISVATILLLLVAFVLFQEGIRRAFLSTKMVILRLAKWSHRHVTGPDPIIPPPLQR